MGLLETLDQTLERVLVVNQCAYRYRYGFDAGRACPHEAHRNQRFCWRHSPYEEKPLPLPRLHANSDLREADLRNCDLCGSNFVHADLQGADLRNAKLLDCDFRGANLLEAFFEGADLSGCDLYGAYFHQPSLLKAQLRGVAVPPTPQLYPADLRPGTIFADQFIIVEKLGGGSFGLVYKARKMWGVEPLALKILNPHWYSHEEAVKRFWRQSYLISHVRHPNLVEITSVLQRDGFFFLVMEFLKGRSLHELLESEEAVAWTVKEKLRFLHGVVQGLMALAEQKILHRDVKPANIVVQSDRSAKLIDFELAKFLDLSAMSQSAAPGTPRYWSPEHIEPLQKYGEFSDIYSFGLVAYELLTGRFPQEDGTEGLYRWDRMQSTPKPLRAVNSKISPRTEAVVLRCLDHDFRSRYQTFAELELAWRELLQPEPEPEPKPEPVPPPVSRAPGLLILPSLVRELEWATLPGGKVRRGTSVEEIVGLVEKFQCQPYLFTNELFSRLETLQPYAIAKTPLTVSLFLKHCNEAKINAGQFPRLFDLVEREPDLPVTEVDFVTALAFARAFDCDLPTEAEWENAARGQERRLWPWGNDLVPRKSYCHVNHLQPGPVGRYPDGASPEGVLDLGGNVWEWTTTSPDGPVLMKVTKGGSWFDSLAEARGAARFPVCPSTASSMIGFRLIRRKH